MATFIFLLKLMAFDSGRVFANYFYSYVCQFTKFYRTFLYSCFAFGFSF